MTSVFIAQEPKKPSVDKKIASTHWSQGLYAAMEDKSMVEYDDEMICIIKDKYPKALKHFLVLPKVKMSTIYELEWSKHKDLLNIMVEKAKEQIGKYKNVFPNCTGKAGKSKHLLLKIKKRKIYLFCSLFPTTYFDQISPNLWPK